MMQKITQAFTKRDQRGFTLIELLVVIAIIAVLAALVLAALSSAQKGARDSKRRSDLNQYRTALVQYNSDGNAYPTTAATIASGATSLSGGSLAPLQTGNYVSQVPAPPATGATAQQTYYYFSNGSGFALCTQLERSAKWLFVTSTGSDDTKAATCAATDSA